MIRTTYTTSVRKPRTRKPTHPRFVQLTVGHWQGSVNGCWSNTVYGLTEDGEVYAYRAGKGAWEKLG